ncbi:MAG: hypothetical protein HY533_06845 [Chloroflexi bacterium]|nr:hypothetical protein [Chloroflexota bacterium]
MKGKAIGSMIGFLMAALVVLPAGAALAAKPASATYLALGDSLAVGVGAAPLEWQFGYVGRFGQWFRDSRDGPHQLTNLAVGGETSGSFIAGGQLAAAVGAISDPETDVQVVTLDIGGNDLLGLLGGSCADPATLACQAAVGAALAGFAGNYHFILGSIASALAGDPGAETVLVMTYYNPFDGTGSPYEIPIDMTLLGADMTVNCAALGNPVNVGLNDLITCIGAPYGAQVVDVYPLFDGNALALTHIAEGDIHPNNDGHAAIAAAFVAGAQ